MGYESPTSGPTEEIQDDETGAAERKLVEKNLTQKACLLRPKAIRDPVHDLIRINREIYLSLLDTAPMQRLRRIRQLGLASMVYPGAEHTRFAHSLGVFHLAETMLDHLKVENRYDRVVIKCAALLHDIGHGPFSHVFESVLKKIDYGTTEDRKHESWTKKLLMENSEITGVLDSYSQADGVLQQDIRDAIAKTYYKKDLAEIITSQFDADRLDYMLRDSHMTGVQYGKYDLNWLLRCLTLNEATYLADDQTPHTAKKLMFDLRRGISCLDEYVLGNLHLYQHVYFHKTVLAAEGMLINLLVRAVDILKDGGDVGFENGTLQKLAKGEQITLDEYCQLDDGVVWAWVNEWARKSTDDFLQSCSKSLLNRTLYKAISIKDLPPQKQLKTIRRIEKTLKEKGFDPKYHLYDCSPDRKAYTKLKAGEIYLWDESGENKSMQYSELEGSKYPVSKALTDFAAYEDFVLVVPPEFKDITINLVEEVRNE